MVIIDAIAITVLCAASVLFVVTIFLDLWHATRRNPMGRVAIVGFVAVIASIAWVGIRSSGELRGETAQPTQPVEQEGR